MKKPTQADIARAVGVSPATVALVVGNSSSSLRERLSPATIAKVQQKAIELGYSPHKGAQMMRKGRSNLIAMLNCGGYTELAAKKVYHIGRLVHEAGYDFQVIESYFWSGDAQRLVDQIISFRPEALAVVGSLQNDFGAPHVERLIRYGIPLVSMSVRLPGVSLVRYDAKAPFRALTNWYLDQGRKRLLLVLNPAGALSEQVQERVNGFKEVIMERTGQPPTVIEGLSYQKIEPEKGISAASVMNRNRKVSFDPFRAGMDAMEAIAHWPEMPNAVLGINDEFAIGALTVCSRHGISVPGDMMISGFDNLAYGTQGPVSLTSVEQPLEAMCEAVIEMMREQLGKEVRLSEQPVDRVIPCEIVWRESTAAPKISTVS